MPDAVEREIKLSYDSPAVARRAVVEAGATPLRARRLQNDYLLDRETAPLGDRQCTLRVRVDDDRAYVTFKGAPGPGRMKVRDELETTVGNGELLLRLFEQLGFRVWFRYQKYREEFRRGDLVIAVDESPIGTFVELEGSESCCGSAGIYSALRPADAAAILEPKLEALRACGAKTLVTANPGCQLQWQSGIDAADLDVEVLHLAELLERSLPDSN